MYGRLPNTDVLPLRLHGRQWYLRKVLPSGRRLEYGLGTKNKDEALRRARQVLHDKLNAEQFTGWQAKVAEGLAPRGWLRVMAANSSNRARKFGWESLDVAALEAVALRCGGYCEVSGLPLELAGGKRHPFQPSLDRRDCKLGYAPDNVRIVALAVNYCMSHWGEDVFLRIAAGTLSKHLQQIADGRASNGSGKSPSLVTTIAENG